MSTNEQDQQRRVGFFLLIGLVALVFSVFVLGGDKRILRSYVKIYAKMPQVQGLNLGSLVSLAGIPIGNIREIVFDNDRKNVRITMKVQESFLEALRKGSTIEVRTQGALGDKFVYITPGPIDAEQLRDGDYIEMSNTQDLMGVLSEKGAEAAKVFDVLNETLLTLKSINNGNKISSILSNLKDSSDQIKEMAKESKSFISDMKAHNSQNINSAVARLNSILTKIDKGEGTLGGLINDPSVHEQLKKILGSGQRKQFLQSIFQNTIDEKGSK